MTAVGYHWRWLDTVDEVASLLEKNPARLVSGYWLDFTPLIDTLVTHNVLLDDGPGS